MTKLLISLSLILTVLIGSIGVSFAEGIWFAIKENPKCFIWNSKPIPSEIVSWDGVCLNGKTNGKGKLIWRFKKNTIWKESIFVGEFKDGKYNGQGTYTFANGTVKEGIWENNKFQYARKIPTPRPTTTQSKKLLW